MIFIPISHSRQPKIAQTIKHNDNREPHFPAINVVFVQVTIEPADSEIIRRRHDPCCTNGVIRAYVADDSNLRRNADVGEEKAPEQRRKGATDWPVINRVEEQLVTSISVFLPAGQLVVNGQGNALFEAIAGPCGKTNDVPVTLQTKRHIEVLADHVFCPKLLLAVVIYPRNLLDGFPAQNGVVADERGYVTIRYCVADSAIEKVREEGNAILEVCIRYLHDGGGEL